MTKLLSSVELTRASTLVSSRRNAAELVAYNLGQQFVLEFRRALLNCGHRIGDGPSNRTCRTTWSCRALRTCVALVTFRTWRRLFTTRTGNIGPSIPARFTTLTVRVCSTPRVWWSLQPTTPWALRTFVASGVHSLLWVHGKFTIRALRQVARSSRISTTNAIRDAGATGIVERRTWWLLGKGSHFGANDSIYRHFGGNVSGGGVARI